MKVDPVKFKRLLKAGEKKPVYLLHGPETFLLREALDRLVRDLTQGGNDAFDLVSLTAMDAKPGDIHADLAQMGMFGGDRVVVVRHLDGVDKKWLDEMAGFLDSPLDNARLILTANSKVDGRGKLYKAVSKIGLVVEFSPIRESEATGWLARRAKGAGKELTPQAADILVARVGADLAGLAAELEKLVLYLGDRRTIGEDDVRACSAVLKGYENFDFVGAVCNRDGLKAVEILHYLMLSGQPGGLGPLLIGALAWRLRGVWLARAALDRGAGARQAESELAAAAPAYRYSARDFIRQAGLVPAEKLAQAFIQLHQADLAIKTGSGVRGSLEGFALWYCA